MNPSVAEAVAQERIARLGFRAALERAYEDRADSLACLPLEEHEFEAFQAILNATYGLWWRNGGVSGPRRPRIDSSIWAIHLSGAWEHVPSWPWFCRHAEDEFMPESIAPWYVRRWRDGVGGQVWYLLFEGEGD